MSKMVGRAVGGRLGEVSVGSIVGQAVGSTVGSSIGEIVGIVLRCTVGKFDPEVGIIVSEGVGSSEFCHVGDSVFGVAVGENVGDRVHEQPNWSTENTTQIKYKTLQLAQRVRTRKHVQVLIFSVASVLE